MYYCEAGVSRLPTCKPPNRLCWCAVFKTWNVELKWMATSAWLQEAVKKSADLHGMLDHHQQVILMQSHHLRDFCKSCLSTACSQLDVFRLQRLVAAVARLTLRQRMQLVFEGYRARFAKIGAITLGMLPSASCPCAHIDADAAGHALSLQHLYQTLG